MQIETIAALRVQIATIGRAGCSAAPHLPFGRPALDTYLPGGGLPLGAVYEVSAGGPAIEHAAAPALFAAGVLARPAGPALLVPSAAATR